MNSGSYFSQDLVDAVVFLIKSQESHLHVPEVATLQSIELLTELHDSTLVIVEVDFNNFI